MYEYKAQVVKIVDGDTYDLDVDLGFYLTQRMRLRLLDINTPEVRGVPTEERMFGLACSAFVVQTIPVESIVRIVTYKTDSFGRYLADVYYGPTYEINLAERIKIFMESYRGGDHG